MKALITIESREAQGIIKTTAIRLSPENTILFVPKEELAVGGYLFSKKILDQAKEIFRKELEKNGIPWTQIQKRKKD